MQQVRIPAGDDVVTFHYRPPHLLVASVLSLGAIVLLVVLLARAWCAGDGAGAIARPGRVRHAGPR